MHFSKYCILYSKMQLANIATAVYAVYTDAAILFLDCI